MIEFHEAANIFPLDEENLGELANDIGKNGQQVPIEVLDGKILDGRRRFKACQIAGKEPKFKDVQVADPVAYVLSLNLHRRQLSDSEKAMIGGRAAKLWEKYAEEASERMKAGKGADGSGGRGNQKNPVVSGPQGLGEKTRERVAAAVGSSGPMVQRAKKILTHGTPELVRAVDDGKITVTAAAPIAAMEPDDQREAVAERTTDIPHHPKPQPSVEPPERKVLGKGVILAHEAINCLTRIPKNDALRKQGFRLVTDWIKRNP